MTVFNFEVPEFAKRFMVVRPVFEGFPSKTKTSARAKRAAIDTLVKQGMPAKIAEQSVSAREKLFPGGELDELHKPKDAFNYWLKSNVMRWMATGEMIASVHRIDAIQNKHAACELQCLDVWHRFMANYDATLAKLQALMGASFDPSMYKPKSELESRFRVDLILRPVPNPDQYSDYVGGLTPAQADALKQRMAEQVEAAANEAQEQFKRDMHELCNKMSVSLVGGKIDGKYTRFSSSNLDQLRNLVQSGLNLTSDPHLDAALMRVEAAVDATEQAAKVRDNRKKSKYDQHLQDEAARKCKAAADSLAGLL
jgi:hypothetical protein